MIKMCLEFSVRHDNENDNWFFRRTFEVQSVPRIGENISNSKGDIFESVTDVCYDLVTGIVYVHADCNVLSCVASWFVKFPDWEIMKDSKEEFRKDETELRRGIEEHGGDKDFEFIFEEDE